MVRRPMTALVEQGILPPPKTNPVLHLHRQKLERAKMGDMLRAKIARRPDRQELVHRHILEDMPPGVDPSLCDKQRQLKRAKLADTLSNQLSLRPGPLELIQKNILHTDDEAVEQAVKGGQIPFRPTAEGLPLRHVDVPHRYTVSSSFEEDSSSDVAQNSPPDLFQGVAAAGPAVVGKSESSDSVFSGVSRTSEATAESVESRRASSDAVHASPAPPPQPPAFFAVPSPLGGLSGGTYSQRCAPGKDQSRRTKKAKPKSSTAKARTIKFHEYKVRKPLMLLIPHFKEIISQECIHSSSSFRVLPARKNDLVRPPRPRRRPRRPRRRRRVTNSCSSNNSNCCNGNWKRNISR